MVVRVVKVVVKMVGVVGQRGVMGHGLVLLSHPQMHYGQRENKRQISTRVRPPPPRTHTNTESHRQVKTSDWCHTSHVIKGHFTQKIALYYHLPAVKLKEIFTSIFISTRMKDEDISFIDLKIKMTLNYIQIHKQNSIHFNTLGAPATSNGSKDWWTDPLKQQTQ